LQALSSFVPRPDHVLVANGAARLIRRRQTIEDLLGCEQIDSAVVLDSTETGRLVRALRDRQTAAQLEVAAPAGQHARPPRSRRAGSAPPAIATGVTVAQ
jgi:hypothetical protein